MARLLFGLLTVFSLGAYANIGVFYYDNMFGHVHLKPSRYSSSVTTIACGHPLRVIEGISNGNENWFVVKVGGVKGHVHAEFLSPDVPKCFQTEYPRFFNALNLDLAQLYFWGRLYDQFVIGKSKVQ